MANESVHFDNELPEYHTIGGVNHHQGTVKLEKIRIINVNPNKDKKLDMGDLEFKLNSKDIRQSSEIVGTISVSYPGRYDGVVVNTTILDSNEHIIYKSYNQKKISQHVSRLFINKDTMPENKVEFTISHWSKKGTCSLFSKKQDFFAIICIYA